VGAPRRGKKRKLRVRKKSGKVRVEEERTKMARASLGV